MTTISLIVIFGTGVAVGMYISSQIETSIDKNIKRGKRN